MTAPDSRGRFHAPAVRAQAERLGVDLGTVEGTGAGGRVTLANVTAAARPAPSSGVPAPVVHTSPTAARANAAYARAQEIRAQQDAAYLELFGEPVPRQAPLRPVEASRVRPHTRPSVFNRSVEVTVDAAGLNPLLEDVAQTHPCYELAIRDSAPPTVFNSGDLPPFLASGLDPKVLLELPWEARHYAAQAESRAEVFDMVERYAADPTVYDGEHTTTGTEDFLDRMRSWLAGPDRTSDVYDEPV